VLDSYPLLLTADGGISFSRLRNILRNLYACRGSFRIMGAVINDARLMAPPARRRGHQTWRVISGAYQRLLLSLRWFWKQFEQ
jgi:hypothetical protein